MEYFIVKRATGEYMVVTKSYLLKILNRGVYKNHQEKKVIGVHLDNIFQGRCAAAHYLSTLEKPEELKLVPCSEELTNYIAGKFITKK